MNKKKELFKIEGVTKIYGKQFIFNNISFTINSEEILGIVGKSGSGKTTFLNMLVGLTKPEIGHILFRDKHLINSVGDGALRSVFKGSKTLKKMYGFASQKPSFYPNLTAMENLMYFGSLYNIPKKALELNAESLLKLVDLEYSRHMIAKSMSGGMQKRLNIACSLIHDPDILILDEPTSDLDPILSNKVWEILKAVNQKGTTIIIVSHNISDLENLCDRMIIFKDGKIAASGSPDEIKEKHFTQESIHLQSIPGNYSKIMSEVEKVTSKHIEDWKVKEGNLVINTAKTNKVLKELIKILDTKKEQIIDIEITKPSLDKIFIEIEGRKNKTITKKPSKIKTANSLSKASKKENKKRTKKHHKRKNKKKHSKSSSKKRKKK